MRALSTLLVLLASSFQANNVLKGASATSECSPLERRVALVLSGGVQRKIGNQNGWDKGYLPLVPGTDSTDAISDVYVVRDLWFRHLKAYDHVNPSKELRIDTFIYTWDIKLFATLIDVYNPRAIEAADWSKSYAEIQRIASKTCHDPASSTGCRPSNVKLVSHYLAKTRALQLFLDYAERAAREKPCRGPQYDYVVASRPDVVITKRLEVSRYGFSATASKPTVRLPVEFCPNHPRVTHATIFGDKGSVMVTVGNGGNTDFIYLMNITNARHFANLWTTYCPSRKRDCDNFNGAHYGAICRFWASLGVAQLQMEEIGFATGTKGIETFRDVCQWKPVFKKALLAGLSRPVECFDWAIDRGCCQCFVNGSVFSHLYRWSPARGGCTSKCEQSCDMFSVNQQKNCLLWPNPSCSNFTQPLPVAWRSKKCLIKIIPNPETGQKSFLKYTAPNF